MILLEFRLDFNIWCVLIPSIVTKMFNPLHRHIKMFFQKNELGLFMEIGDFRKPFDEASFIWKSKYLSPSHFLDSVESWSFSCWLKWHTIGGYLHVFVYVIVLVRKAAADTERELRVSWVHARVIENTIWFSKIQILKWN